MANHDQLDPTRTPRRILVPVDGHPSTGGAVERAAALAGALGAELLLLGVNVPPLAPGAGPVGPALSAADLATEREATESLTRENLRRAQQQLPAGVRSRTAFAWGAAGPAIVGAARDEAADLIVVPMARGGAISHLLRDGADRHVLHQSPVPVLVVPSP